MMPEELANVRHALVVLSHSALGTSYHRLPGANVVKIVLHLSRNGVIFEASYTSSCGQKEQKSVVVVVLCAGM